MAEAITRSLLDVLKAEMGVALAAVAVKHGVSIEVGSASFTTHNATFKVEVAVLSEDGIAETREAVDFRLLATQYGFDPADLGETFHFNGEDYTIVGLSRNSPKYPILCRHAAGTKRFPTVLVVAALTVKRNPKPKWGSGT